MQISQQKHGLNREEVWKCGSYREALKKINKKKKTQLYALSGE